MNPTIRLRFLFRTFEYIFMNSVTLVRENAKVEIKVFFPTSSFQCETEFDFCNKIGLSLSEKIPGTEFHQYFIHKILHRLLFQAFFLTLWCLTSVEFFFTLFLATLGLTTALYFNLTICVIDVPDGQLTCNKSFLTSGETII